MGKMKWAMAGLAIFVVLWLVFTLVQIWNEESEKTNYMMSLCEGEFGYGDVGFGYEALCVYNDFPLRWSNESWILEMSLFEVGGGAE